MFNLLYVQLFNWAIDPLAKVLCSIGFLFNSFWAIRDVQWDMFGSPATEFRVGSSSLTIDFFTCGHAGLYVGRVLSFQRMHFLVSC